MALTVVMVSQVYTYLQTHQTVYLKYAQLVVCRSHPNKVFFLNEVCFMSYMSTIDLLFNTD